VSPRFCGKNIRYAILAVFLVAAIICPSPDLAPCAFMPVPMLVFTSWASAVAWWVHPARRKAKRSQGELVMIFSLSRKKPAIESRVLQVQGPHEQVFVRGVEISAFAGLGFQL